MKKSISITNVLIDFEEINLRNIDFLINKYKVADDI